MTTTTYHAPPATYRDGVLYRSGDRVAFQSNRLHGGRTGTVHHGSNAGFRGLEYTILDDASSVFIHGVPCADMRLLERPEGTREAISHQNGWNPATGGMDR